MAPLPTSTKADICRYFMPFAITTPENKLVIKNMCADPNVDKTGLSKFLSQIVGIEYLLQSTDFNAFLRSSLTVCEATGATDCLGYYYI